MIEHKVMPRVAKGIRKLTQRGVGVVDTRGVRSSR
jgi:hypothetical protein